MSAIQRSVYESVFGQPDARGSMADMRSAFEVITQRQWGALEYLQEDARLKELYVGMRLRGDISPHDVSPTDHERMMARRIVSEVFHDRQFSRTMLFDWPVFDTILEAKGKKLAGGNALMLGSLEPVSSLAFVALSKEIYGADEAFIVDEMTGDDKQKHGNFMLGSPLDLPHEDGTMDIVQAYYTLDTMQGFPEFPTRDDRAYRMFSEASRVLKPDGQLIMVESFPPNDSEGGDANDYQEACRMATQNAYANLVVAGFAKVSMAPAVSPVSSRRLLDPRRDFWADGQRSIEDSYMVYAAKT